MTVAVGYKGVQFAVGKGRFVYGYIRTDIFRKHQPFVCMVKFAPFTVSAKYFLILFLECTSVYVVEIVKRTAGMKPLD